MFSDQRLVEREGREVEQESERADQVPANGSRLASSLFAVSGPLMDRFCWYER